jgi:hypothetical protein
MTGYLGDFGHVCMPVRVAVAEVHMKFHNSDRKRIEVEK